MNLAKCYVKHRSILLVYCVLFNYTRQQYTQKLQTPYSNNLSNGSQLADRPDVELSFVKVFLV